MLETLRWFAEKGDWGGPVFQESVKLAERGLPVRTGFRTNIMKVVKTAPDNQAWASCSALTETTPGLVNTALFVLLPSVVA